MADSVPMEDVPDEEEDLDLGDCEPDCEWEVADKWTPLHKAAQNLNIPKLQAFLSSGKFDVNAVTRESNHTPLHEAIYGWDDPENPGRKVKAIQLLHAHGADLTPHDCVGKTPLHSAAEGGYYDAVEALLELGADPNVDSKEPTVHPHGHANECGCGSQSSISGLLAALSGGSFVRSRFREHVTPMHVAAGSGNVEIVKLLLAKGGKADAYDDDDGTPVHNAIIGNHLEVIKILVEAPGGEASLTVAQKMGHLPIHWAATSSPEVLKYILSFKQIDADVQNTVEDNWASGRTALAVACDKKAGFEENVKILLDAGADPNKQLRKKATPFLLALNSGNVGIARVLLERGADMTSIRAAEIPPLHVAATRGHTEMCKLLVEKGCDVNMRTTDGDEYTPIHNAAGYGGDQNGSAECIRTLLELGADIEAKNYDGRRPLHMACFKGRINCVKELIKSGADIEALDDNSWTPVMFAAQYGHLAIVQFLIESDELKTKAQVGKRTTGGPGWGNMSGKTAADLAKANNHEEIVKILINAGDTLTLDEDEDEDEEEEKKEDKEQQVEEVDGKNEAEDTKDEVEKEEEINTDTNLGIFRKRLLSDGESSDIVLSDSRRFVTLENPPIPASDLSINSFETSVSSPK